MTLNVYPAMKMNGSMPWDIQNKNRRPTSKDWKLEFMKRYPYNNNHIAGMSALTREQPATGARKILLLKITSHRWPCARQPHDLSVRSILLDE